jgi:hypothetical protein
MAASLGYMTTGLVRGFSSPGIPSMQQKSPHLVPNESAFSWLSKYILPLRKSDWSECEEETIFILMLLCIWVHFPAVWFIVRLCNKIDYSVLLHNTEKSQRRSLQFMKLPCCRLIKSIVASQKLRQMKRTKFMFQQNTLSNYNEMV